jgi:predicted Zn-dependent peptidase
MERIPTCRSVSFGIWVKTGSKNESESNNGISHFIEHMLFKGTARHSARDIADQFDGIGGNVNAFTAKEYTCYYAKVLDEHLPIAVDILADMFFNSNLDEKDLEKERNVILEEISMYEDTPDDFVHDLIAQAAYGTHPLGFSILGPESNLTAMKPDHLREYMNRQYTLDNTVIGIAGNVDESVFELLEKHFGHFSRSGSEESVAKPNFLSRTLFHQKQSEQNHICLSLPGCSLKDPRLYPMILLNNALGGGMSSRLFQEIREKRGLAYSVYSYHTAHLDSGMLTIYTGTAPKQTEEVMEVTMELLRDAAVNGLSEAELRKGKEQMKGSLILSLESTSSRMNRLGKNELMLQKHHTLDELIDRIETVQLEDIAELSRTIFAEPLAMAMVGSSDEAIRKYPQAHRLV